MLQMAFLTGLQVAYQQPALKHPLLTGLQVAHLQPALKHPRLF